MKALILVDIQNDFFPGGALAVPEGDKILPAVNRLLKSDFDLVIATKDWHPKDHCSFAVNHGKVPGEHVVLSGVDQLLWPVHCVQGETGADFAPGWDTTKVTKVFYKGTDKEIDSYSTFFDNRHLRETGLADFLRRHGVTDLYFAGLATDYCVKYSVLDAAKMGFNLFVIEDGCRGVNLTPGDDIKAFEEMRLAGAKIISSGDISMRRT